MSPTPPDTPGPARSGSARVAGAPPSRRTWLVPLLLGLLALVALLLLLSRCGGNDASTATTTSSSAGSSSPPPATASDPAATPSASAGASPSGSAPASGGAAGGNAGGAAGTVVAGGDSLLGGSSPLELGNYHDQQAVGRAVRVQSVPADEGFWVGTNPTDRIWVQLTGTRGESDYKVREGDTVDFTGTVTQAPDGFAAVAGVTVAEGAAQLTRQGHYIAAPSSSVTLSD